jgi:hypothetical protein
MDLFPFSGEGREISTLLGALERVHLNNCTYNVSETGSVEGRETPTLLGVLERANLSHWTIQWLRLVSSF